MNNCNFFDENSKYTIIKNSEESISKISIFSNVLTNITNLRTNEKNNQDLSPSNLKTLISQIENEKEQDVLITKIREIEAYLEQMKPTKCTINFKKYFTLLSQCLEK